MVSEEKQTLRKTMRQRLRELPAGWRLEASAKLRAHLGAFPAFSKARCLYAFAPTPTEPDWIGFGLPPRKTHVFPRIRGSSLEWIPVLRLDELAPGAFGIFEPPEGRILPPLPDLLLVPGLAFDHAGRRLGRGAGFYDRAIKDLPGFRLGVAFAGQIVSRVPAEPHDQEVDGILTENGVVICSGGMRSHQQAADPLRGDPSIPFDR